MTSISIDSANFDKEVLSSDKTVIVDFWAEWCGPCKMIAPHLDEIATEMSDNVKVVKVDVDANQDLAVQYGIRSMPTLLAFKNGEVKDQKVGADSKSGLSQWISSVAG